MITYDGNNCNLSLNQQIGRLFTHKQYVIKQSYLLMFLDGKEWIPHSVYMNKYIAEYQMKKLKNDHKDITIIPVEFYALKVKI